MRKRLDIGDNKLMITDNPDLIPSNQQYSRRTLDLIDKMHAETLRGTPRVIRRLKSLIERYPNVLQFKNYLTVAYNAAGNVDKAFAYNQQIVKEHPDYLFAKTNLASQYLESDQAEKVPEILGEELTLPALYPERKIFHTSEFLNFYWIVGRYYAAVEELDKAEEALEMMQQIDHKHEITIQFSKRLLLKRMKVGMKNLMEKKAKLRPYTSKEYNKEVQTDKAPTFYHQEIEALYQHDLDIPSTVLDSILALPRETLIKDLELVLKDGLYRYEYYRKKVEQEEWDDEHMSFMLHALFLLTELKATESLPVVWEILEQGSVLLDFWFSDYLTEYFFEALYQLSEQKLEVLSPMLLAPEIYEFSRILISKVASNIVLHQPERREEVIAWYREMFNYFLAHQEDDKMLSMCVLGFMVSNILKFRGMELLPDLEKIHEANLVDTMICGDYQKVKEELRAPAYPESFERYILTDNLLDRYEIYGKGKVKEKIPIPMADVYPPEKSDFKMPEIPDFLLKTLKGLEEEEEENQIVEKPQRKSIAPTTSYRKPKKVSRNAPCPCGSNKKYKHCCGKKR